MKRKATIPAIALAVLCIAIFMKPYIFTGTPKSPLLTIYPQHVSPRGLYVLKDGSIQTIVGEERWFDVKDSDLPNTVRRATEEEGLWKKVTERKQRQIDEAQFQKLIELLDELESRNIKLPMEFSTLHRPKIFVFYKGKEYGMFVIDGKDIDINDTSAISSADEYTLLRSIIKIAFDASPIPIEPLPLQSEDYLQFH
jgi:hypothetical protein